MVARKTRHATPSKSRSRSRSQPKTAKKNPPRKKASVTKKGVWKAKVKYHQMIEAGLKKLKATKKGASREQLLAYIMQTYKLQESEKQVNNKLKFALRAAISQGRVAQAKGRESYQLPRRSASAKQLRRKRSIKGRSVSRSRPVKRSASRKALLQKRSPTRTVKRSASRKALLQKRSPARTAKMSASTKALLQKRSPARTAKMSASTKALLQKRKLAKGRSAFKHSPPKGRVPAKKRSTTKPKNSAKKPPAKRSPSKDYFYY